MKMKIFTSLFLLLFFLSSKAQKYLPVLEKTNVWSYTCNNPVPIRIEQTDSVQNCAYPFAAYGNPFTEYTGPDTSINSVKYKTLYRQNVFNGSTCFIGYVREDSTARKVFFMDNTKSPESLIYDFNMKLNDSLLLNFQSSGSYYSSGFYRLDSTRQKQFGPTLRNVFYLSHSGNGYNQREVLIWVEGIGNQLDLIYTYSTLNGVYEPSSTGGIYYPCRGYQYRFNTFLTCFEHNQKVYFDTCAYNAPSLGSCNKITHDSCIYIYNCGGVVNTIEASSIFIKPNPANEYLTINFNGLKYSSLTLYNMSGQKMIEKTFLQNETENEKQIYLNTIPDGFYLLQVKTSEGFLFKKIIVEH